MSKQNTFKLLLDLSTFMTLLIVSAPRATGDTIHEWLGVALAGAIVVHLLFNWNWIVDITSRLFTRPIKGHLFNYTLNLTLFVSGIMIILSGLMISKTVIPFFGISLPQNIIWRGLHEFFTNIVMVLMGLHVAVHWSWIVNMFKKIFSINSAPKAVMPSMNIQRKDG